MEEVSGYHAYVFDLFISIPALPSQLLHAGNQIIRQQPLELRRSMEIVAHPPDTIRAPIPATLCVLKPIRLRRVQNFRHPRMKVVERGGCLERLFVRTLIAKYGDREIKAHVFVVRAPILDPPLQLCVIFLAVGRAAGSVVGAFG